MVSVIDPQLRPPSRESSSCACASPPEDLQQLELLSAAGSTVQTPLACSRGRPPRRHYDLGSRSSRPSASVHHPFGFDLTGT